jgi:hypothetical protein
MSQEGDLVLVHVEGKPAFFARIETISPDVKPGWYQVGFLILQVPLVQVTWILRREYVDGASFTMGGRNVILERVVAPAVQPPPDLGSKPERPTERQRPADGEKGKVISLFPRR